MAAERPVDAIDAAIRPDNAEREAETLARITGMWEFVDGAPFTAEGVQRAVDVLSRLSSALRPDDQVGAISITIGPRTWRYRQLPAMLLAMPEGGPVTAILGPEGIDRG